MLTKDQLAAIDNLALRAMKSPDYKGDDYAYNEKIAIFNDAIVSFTGAIHRELEQIESGEPGE